jgi:KaiC/GvpD/RAD55 family RecA-like ATPase
MKAVEYVAAHLDDDDYDPRIPGGLLAMASEMAVDVDSSVLDYATAVPPDENIRTGVHGLGFSEKFDGYLDGGKGPGELFLYCSISGVGKTSMLLLDAANAAAHGMNVLYITKEVNKNKCVQRLDQCFTRYDKTDLITKAQSVMKKRASIPGKIWIQDWSHTSTTVADIRALVLKMRQRGEVVDYLIVDYMELIEAEFFNRNQPRFNFTAVAKDLRALANEFWFPVVSAWQAKRLAMNKLYLEKDDLGEDWNVVKTADIIVGLNQNSEENRGKILRVNIIKQRESTNRSTMVLHADLDRMYVCEASAMVEQWEVEYGAEKVDMEDSGKGS